MTWTGLLWILVGIAAVATPIIVIWRLVRSAISLGVAASAAGNELSQAYSNREELDSSASRPDSHRERVSLARSTHADVKRRRRIAKSARLERAIRRWNDLGLVKYQRTHASESGLR